MVVQPLQDPSSNEELAFLGGSPGCLVGGGDALDWGGIAQGGLDLAE